MRLRLALSSMVCLITSVSAVSQLDAQTSTADHRHLAAADPGRNVGAVFDVRAFGAQGDGRALDTAAIQAAIDACTRDHGGTVLVPAGEYVAGTLFLKSNVTLQLAAAATILGSTDIRHYAEGIERCGFVTCPEIDKCLVYAADAENIAIRGPGTIDGRGGAFLTAGPGGSMGQRPMLMRFARCRNVVLEGVNLRNAAAWCAHFLRSSGVRIHGVNIYNRAAFNNDGIDLMSTENVRISDCSLLCEDDCICFQNMADDMAVRDVVITNCVMSTRWAAIRSGGAHRGGIRNVAVSNCVIYDTYGCGIKLQTSGNGSLEDMVFSNIVMDGVSCPISLRLGNHHYNGEKRDEKVPFGKLRNLMFQNIRARVLDEATLKKSLAAFYGSRAKGAPIPGEERQCMSICGIPGHPVEGVTLSDISVSCPGGGTMEEAARREFPELADQYPEYFMWGVLPAYGLYARHVKGLALRGVRFELASADARAAIVCDDAEGVEFVDLRAAASPGCGSLVCLRAARDVLARGCRPLGQVPAFMQVEGRDCREIVLMANDLHNAGVDVRPVGGAEPRQFQVSPQPKGRSE